MAEWKKVVVSGSSAALSALDLDTALAATSGGTGINSLTGEGGKVLKVNSGGTAFELGTDSSEFTAAGISGSLGDNADLIRSLTAVGISGSFTEDSASIATDIAALELNGVFTAAGISGSLGDNADLIRSLTATGISGSFTEDSASIATDIAALELNGVFTAAGISGSLGDNADLIRSLTAVGISGSFTEDSASIATDIAALELSGVFTAAGISGSLGDNADLIRSLTAVGISGSSANKLPLGGGTMAGNIVMGNNNISGVGDLTVTGNTTLGNALTDIVTVSGDLVVTGTSSFNHSTNLSVADKYILLNSGSQGNELDSGGIVIQGPNQDVGALFGYISGSSSTDLTRRWGVADDFDADSAGDFTPAAFMSNVVVGTDNTLPTGTYAKKGNIFIGNSEDEVWIYGS